MANEIIREKNLQAALEATYRLFLQVGIETATREMLIGECGLSRATISRYFQNKTDWVIQTAEYIGKRIDNSRAFDMAMLEDEHILGINVLDLFLGASEKLWQEDSRLFALWGEFKTYIYRHHENIKDANDKLDADIGHVTIVKNILEKGIRDGSIVLSNSADMTADIICKIYYGLLINLALDSAIDKAEALLKIENFKNSLLNRFKK